MASAANGDHESKVRFAIVGGGICGLALAVAMLKRGLHVDIYEQAPKFGEIGAGVAFGPNATRALHACDPSLLDAFNNVATRNQWPQKEQVWFDWLDGFSDKDGIGIWRFRLENSLGANSVHRAHFLDEIVKLLPDGVAHFGKRLENITETSSSGPLTMHFGDGTSATADAVIGCDGIKSRTRRVMLGADHPSVTPVYGHKYGYRGLIPIEKAAAALGDDVARNAHMHMGYDGHVLTFPVSRGSLMNVVAFKTNADDWPDHSRLTLPSTRDAALEDFEGFGGGVRAILGMLEEKLDRWAIFDLGDHPLPTYYKGRICLVGDSAHASSPHQGAGAGVGVEDAAVMAELLAEVAKRHNAKDSAATAKNMEQAFTVYDESRRKRTQWLVQSSRRVGDLYEWRAEGVGDDVEKVHEELQRRCEEIWNADIKDFITSALANLRHRIGEA